MGEVVEWRTSRHEKKGREKKKLGKKEEDCDEKVRKSKVKIHSNSLIKSNSVNRKHLQPRIFPSIIHFSSSCFLRRCTIILSSAQSLCLRYVLNNAAVPRSHTIGRCFRTSCAMSQQLSCSRESKEPSRSCKH